MKCRQHIMLLTSVMLPLIACAIIVLQHHETKRSEFPEVGRIHFEFKLSNGVPFERKVISSESVEPEPILGQQVFCEIDPVKLGKARQLLRQAGVTTLSSEQPPRDISDGVRIDLKIILGESERSVVIYDSVFSDYQRLAQLRRVFDELQKVASD